MTAPKRKPRGVHARLTTWVEGAIAVVATQWCDIAVSFRSYLGQNATFRLDPEDARELAARLLAAADAADRSSRDRVRALKGGAE